MKKIPAKLKFLLVNLLLAIILIAGITTYVMYWLEDYTQHGSFIAVPAFHDFTPNEAHDLAHHNHLRVQIIDSLYDENAKPGTVVEQYPAPGSQVKENRLIHLTINASSPEKIVFPSLQNAAYRQTLQTLETRGFRIGKIQYEPSEFKNLVLTLKNNDRDIQPGELLSKGSVIDIVLGRGEGSNTVYMPLLHGKKLKEAMALTRKSYLNIGEIVPDGSITTPQERENAFVYQQSPYINQIVEAGTPVKLFITLKQEKLAALDSLVVTE